MTTTLDLPADLVRELKLRVAPEGLDGLAGKRVKLPLIECQRPGAGQEMTPDQVAAILLQQEGEWSHETSGCYAGIEK